MRKSGVDVHVDVEAIAPPSLTNMEEQNNRAHRPSKVKKKTKHVGGESNIHPLNAHS